MSTKIDLEAAIAELDRMEDDDLREAMISLARDGYIIPNGEKRRGLHVWIANPEKPDGPLN